MRRIIVFFLTSFILCYSMRIIVTAADEPVISENGEYSLLEEGDGDKVSSNAVLSLNESISENQIEGSDHDLIFMEEQEQEGFNVNEDEVIDSNDEDGGNEIVDISSNESVSVSSDGISQNEVSGNEVSINEVSSNAIVSGDDIKDLLEEDDKEMLSENKADTLLPKKTVISKIEIPTSARIYLDPGNILGQGGVFSDSYKVVNYGNRDVLIKIKDIQILQKWGQELYDISENTPNDIYTGKIKVDLNMVWENKKEKIEKVLKVTDGDVDEYVVYLKAAQYDKNDKFVKLNDSSESEFYFTGDLEMNSNIQWENSGMKLSLAYDIIDDEKSVEEFLENASNKVLDDNNGDDVNKEHEISE